MAPNCVASSATAHVLKHRLPPRPLRRDRPHRRRRHGRGLPRHRYEARPVHEKRALPVITQAIFDLRRLLQSFDQGPIDDASMVQELLSECRNDIDGGDVDSMATFKLERMEQLRWNPPDLSFVIERHGAIVAGRSSRAQKQEWVVNLDTLQAKNTIVGFRQIVPRRRTLDVEPLVDRMQSLARCLRTRLSRECLTRSYESK